MTGKGEKTYEQNFEKNKKGRKNALGGKTEYSAEEVLAQAMESEVLLKGFTKPY